MKELKEQVIESLKLAVKDKDVELINSLTSLLHAIKSDKSFWDILWE